jgi:hypothetical protein
MDESASAPEPVLLIVADISGYTRFMTANVKTFAHSQTIITELIKAIVREIELPLEVAKLEGDAVFLFARKGRSSQSWEAHKAEVGRKLLTLFEVFRGRIRDLRYSTICTCQACVHIESLRLKLIVHSGQALFHQVFNFQELAGVDVIIVHRLLKNSVTANQYLLVTDTAQRDIELPATARLMPSVETYDDIGPVKIGVYCPESPATSAVEEDPHESGQNPSFPARFRMVWYLFLNLWFHPLRALRLGAAPDFRHLPALPGRTTQIGWALLTLLLTPVYVPVATLRAAWRARQQADHTTIGSTLPAPERRKKPARG